MEKVGIFRRSWWAYVVRGILAIVLGIILLSWPGATVKVLIELFGLFALIEGVIELALAIFLAAKLEPWGMVLARSLISLLIGGVLVSRPGVALGVVVILIGIWLIISGFLQLIVAFEMPPMTGRSLLGLGGLLSLIIGILIIAIPFDTVYAVIILIAIASIVSGAWHIFLGFYSLAERRNIEKAA